MRSLVSEGSFGVSSYSVTGCQLLEGTWHGGTDLGSTTLALDISCLLYQHSGRQPDSELKTFTVSDILG